MERHEDIFCRDIQVEVIGGRLMDQESLRGYDGDI